MKRHAMLLSIAFLALQYPMASTCWAGEEIAWGGPANGLRLRTSVGFAVDVACELRLSDRFLLRAEADTGGASSGYYKRQVYLAELKVGPNAAVTAGWRSLRTSVDGSVDKRCVVSGPVAGMVFTF